MVVFKPLTQGVILGTNLCHHPWLSVCSAGLSAGGNLAAAVALRMQDSPFRSLPRLRFQVLLMPVLQGLDFDLPSYRDNDPATGRMLSRDVVAKYVLAYAGLEFTPSVVRQVAQNQHVTSDTRAKLSKFLEQAVLETATVGSKGKRKKAGRSHGVNVTLAKLAEQVVTNPLFSPLLAEEEQIRQVCATQMLYRFDCVYETIIFCLCSFVGMSERERKKLSERESISERLSVCLSSCVCVYRLMLPISSVRFSCTPRFSCLDSRASTSFEQVTSYLAE